MPVMQLGGDCVIDIVGNFVRVSCPTETDRQTDRLTDRDRRTLSVRAASSAKRCDHIYIYYVYIYVCVCVHRTFAHNELACCTLESHMH